MTTFAQSLRALMAERKLSQKELGDAVGVSQTMISNYLSEEDPVEPGIGVVINMAKYFGVTIDSLYPDIAAVKPMPKNGSISNGSMLDDYRIYNKHLIYENENLWEDRKEIWSMLKQFISKSA